MIFLIIWRAVARTTIGKAVMAETRPAPTVGVVTLGTLPGKMTSRPSMAGLAIIQPIMAERRPTPTIGVVTLRALAGEVASWSGMT
jgi:hypothetical protein